MPSPQTRPFDPSVHQLDAAFDLPPALETRTIVIASTPRCGSTMLGRLMHATGHMGLPQEYAHPRFQPYLQMRFGTSQIQDTLAAVISCRTSANGVFSIKLHAEHLPHIGGFEQIAALAPNPVYVHLERRDKLAQALSFARAQQTDRWVKEEAGNGMVPRYDRELIAAKLQNILTYNTQWRHCLLRGSAPFIQLNYEDLCVDISGSLKRIAALAEIDLPPAAIPDGHLTYRQSDADADPWRARFTADLKDGATFVTEERRASIEKSPRNLSRMPLLLQIIKR